MAGRLHAMKTCPYCGGEYPDEAVICSIDGEPLSDGLPSTVPQRKVIRAGSTLSSVFVNLACALTLEAMSIFGGLAVGDGFKAGWTYSFGIVFGDNTKIYRSSSPTEFWIIIGFFVVTFLIMIVLEPCLAIETINQYKKTRALKKKHVAIPK
jgi:hypothetical protein